MQKSMNLVQMKYIGTFKAYVKDFNVQMNATSKMDESFKKSMFLEGLQNWTIDTLFKFSKLPKDVVKSSK